MTLKRQGEDTVVVTGDVVITRERWAGRRSTRERSKGWAGAFVLACLLWLFVILPAAACALGWVLR
jgi:hypothetical protein